MGLVVNRTCPMKLPRCCCCIIQACFSWDMVACSSAQLAQRVLLILVTGTILTPVSSRAAFTMIWLSRWLRRPIRELSFQSFGVQQAASLWECRLRKSSCPIGGDGNGGVVEGLVLLMKSGRLTLDGARAGGIMDRKCSMCNQRFFKVR